ncbi:hypothetical protein LKM2_30 [Leptospira kirschneri serovar Mozdok]|nr:hypothetical protein [Leptospira kirschneri serovar Mozdok]
MTSDNPVIDKSLLGGILEYSICVTLHTTHNYIIKYLIFYIESAFCDRINGTYFYRDQ